ncbi:MAG TPA: hypothetical protein G4N96_11135 [Chloroflexi bacterium]|nr:hypothetical protein [Chloroflexota bacterium]
MSTNVNFTSKQRRAIEWLANPGNDRQPKTQRLLAAEIGVRIETITRWKRKPEFMDAVLARSRELLKSDLPEIYRSLADEAKAGSHKHQKLAFELSGEYVERKEVEVSVPVTIVEVARGE